MTKAEYIKTIASKANTSQIETDEVIRAFINIVNTEDRLVVPGLGTFKKVVLTARTRHNPKTGASIQCPAKTVMRFKEAKKAA